MARRRRRNAPKRRRNAIKLSNPRRRRRSNPRRRKNTAMKLKFDMGSILLGAGLAYYFHSQLKDVLGKFTKKEASLSAGEMAEIEAQAQAEAAADMAGLHYGAIHLNPARRRNRSFGSVHLP